MRKRTLGVVLLAGLAMSGAGAFTGSNVMPAGSDDRKAGYGTVSATGVTVSDVDYDLSTDLSTLERVLFTVNEDVSTGYDLRMTLKSGSTLVGATTDCTATWSLNLATTLDVTDMIGVITCDNVDRALTAFDGVALSVADAGSTS